MNQPQTTVILLAQSEEMLAKNLTELPCCNYLKQTGNNYRDMIKSYIIKDIARELLNPANLITYGEQVNEKQYPKGMLRISDN